MFPLIYAWINGWRNNREAGDLRRHRGHYALIVMVEAEAEGRERDQYANIAEWLQWSDLDRYSLYVNQELF